MKPGVTTAGTQLVLTRCSYIILPAQSIGRSLSCTTVSPRAYLRGCCLSAGEKRQRTCDDVCTPGSDPANASAN